MIPEEYYINDNRSEKFFSTKTFSGFLKKDVVSTLNKCLTKGEIEESCYWSSEYLVSGMHSAIYDKLITFCCKNINITNPKLPTLIYLRYSHYIENLSKITNKYGKDKLIELRNVQTIRNHVAELCCIICQSRKNKSLGLKKINQQYFSPELFQQLLKSNKDYIGYLVRPGDPNELKIVLNEFYTNLINKNYNGCLFWLSWLIEWEKMIIKKNKEYKCGYREIKGVDKKFYCDCIWFVWEILLKESIKKEDEVTKQIQSLYKLFKFNYSNSKKNKRTMFILYAIKYFTDNYLFSSIVPEQHLLIQSTGNINTMYNSRKKHEINNKDYLEEKLNQYNMEQKKKKQASAKKKVTISDQSNQKILTVDQIDAFIIKSKSF